MMTFQATIACENAAFDDVPGVEIARILRGLADRVDNLSAENLGTVFRLSDVNGNRVGFAAMQQVDE